MAMHDNQRRPSRLLLGGLLLASFAVITVDVHGGEDSPLDPARYAVGEAFGPVEATAADVVRPFLAIPTFLRTTGDLKRDVARLEAENSELRREVATSGVDRNRVAELDGLLASAHDTGYDLVPTRVIAMGPGQSFSRTVTVDAGTDDGIDADMTVVNNDGLVGRVLRANRSTATVLLVVDSESVVGGRLGSNAEVGFLRGRGAVGDTGRLDLDLVDSTVTPARGDHVVTWGSERGVPYVPGIPIGTVTSVYSSPRELSQHAVIEPAVDFSSLDLVGVVVRGRTDGDRTVIRADAPRDPGAAR